MSRSLPEWVGKTDDSAIPPRVKLRVFEKKTGLCEVCKRRAVWFQYDHRIALINGGENRESNIQLICHECHSKKTAKDVAVKSKIYRVRTKHLGIKRKKGRPMPGSKASGIRKRMSGAVERH